MKLLKDITKEQAVELATLAYGQVDWIKSDFTYDYRAEEIRDNISIAEDSSEFVLVRFRATTFGSTIDTIRLFIFSNYNLSMDIFRNDPINIIPLGISNQVAIVGKLVEWEFVKF